MKKKKKIQFLLSVIFVMVVSISFYMASSSEDIFVTYPKYIGKPSGQVAEILGLEQSNIGINNPFMDTDVTISIDSISYQMSISIDKGNLQQIMLSGFVKEEELEKTLQKLLRRIQRTYGEEWTEESVTKSTPSIEELLTERKTGYQEKKVAMTFWKKDIEIENCYLGIELYTKPVREKEYLVQLAWSLHQIVQKEDSNGS